MEDATTKTVSVELLFELERNVFDAAMRRYAALEAFLAYCGDDYGHSLNLQMALADALREENAACLLAKKGER